MHDTTEHHQRKSSFASSKQFGFAFAAMLRAVLCVCFLGFPEFGFIAIISIKICVLFALQTMHLFPDLGLNAPVCLSSTWVSKFFSCNKS